MSRKLPKAVSRTIDDLRREGDAARLAEATPVLPEPVAAPAPPVKPATRVTPFAEAAAALRRAGARAIVERHAAYAALAGAMPLPLAEAAGVAAVNLAMIETLAAHYGTPCDRERARSLAARLTGDAAPGPLAAADLLRYVPGLNILWLAMASTAAAASARTLGRLIVEHLERGGTLPDLGG